MMCNFFCNGWKEIQNCSNHAQLDWLHRVGMGASIAANRILKRAEHLKCKEKKHKTKTKTGTICLEDNLRDVNLLSSSMIQYK